MPLDFDMPVVDLTTPALNALNPVTWSLRMPDLIFVGALTLNLIVTKSATGAATKTVPLPSDAVTNSQWLINGTPQRTRLFQDLFGRSGLNALNDAELSGTVQYKQGAGWITADLDGVTVGNEPVLIGSPEDIAIKAALANNTATTAYFALPFIFSEDFRKSYAAALKMGLPTGFGSLQGGAWVASGNIGGLVMQLQMCQLTGAVNAVTAAAISANVEYDNTLAAPGTVIRLSKEYTLNEDYAAGDIEVARQIENKAGEMLQLVLLKTAADAITRVVVKQGQTLVRTMTWEENIASLRRCGVNVAGVGHNQFPIIWDRKDDPTTGLPMLPNAKLSIVATFATANDNPATVKVLTSVYGPKD
jgi:hypothetical protein